MQLLTEFMKKLGYDDVNSTITEQAEVTLFKIIIETKTILSLPTTKFFLQSIF